MLNQLASIQRVQVNIATFGKDIAHKYKLQKVKNIITTIKYMEIYTTEYSWYEYITIEDIQTVHRDIFHDLPNII